MTPSACARQAAVELVQTSGLSVREIACALDAFHARGLAEAYAMDTQTLRNAFAEVVRDRNACLLALDTIWKERAKCTLKPETMDALKTCLNEQ